MHVHTLTGSETKYFDDNNSGSTGVGSLCKNIDFIFPQERNACFKIFYNN